MTTSTAQNTMDEQARTIVALQRELADLKAWVTAKRTIEAQEQERVRMAKLADEAFREQSRIVAFKAQGKIWQ